MPTITCQHYFKVWQHIQSVDVFFMVLTMTGWQKSIFFNLPTHVRLKFYQ